MSSSELHSIYGNKSKKVAILGILEGLLVDNSIASQKNMDIIFIRCSSNLFYEREGGENDMLFTPKEKGQGLVEYALILVLVAIVVIVILAIMGPAIGNIFSQIVNAL